MILPSDTPPAQIIVLVSMRLSDRESALVGPLGRTSSKEDVTLLEHPRGFGPVQRQGVACNPQLQKMECRGSTNERLKVTVQAFGEGGVQWQNAKRLRQGAKFAALGFPPYRKTILELNSPRCGVPLKSATTKISEITLLAGPVQSQRFGNPSTSGRHSKRGD
jgi:hypothetical protein